MICASKVKAREGYTALYLMQWFILGEVGEDIQRLIAPSDLDGCVSTFEQCDSQQDAFLEDSVACGVHDEIDYQVRGSLLVQVTLNLRQAHFPTAQAPRTPQAWKMRQKPL